MAKEKILVIDDEKDFLDVMEKRLNVEGYHVLTALNGIEGLKMAKEKRPDLIICDIKMPIKDGFEVLREIRKNISAKLPIIIASAMDDHDKISRAYDGEANFYASKPIEMATLTRNIRTLLNLYKSRRQ